ncbi:MAG: hydantoinase B/oxoprolinase family protein [Vulcanococcus sp.]|jgi:5-oxoprolinase (ATP-hydrolysing)|uniref:hydantoinase B/oxoprolinase family protein n=1 Tax=Vulcanococcus sp. TaxID=2856995 RepID=UPI0025D519B7|nr:hydantoinase B/oxoprolinase family protein [Vulcanococcus sp.]MBW0174951.1 hydantoinase B/oxoprolinase family protein [Vulcanococcus sp.]MBW0179499.1 hydantoinase B/oxoprolinase family protein [Vulcanococcus sp.]
MAKGSWRFWIDRGGTFTDVVARSPQGELLVEKVLSVQPDQPGDPAVRAIRRLLGLDAADARLPEGWIEEVRLGTTVATNAFLEHNGAPALLLVNQGFADLLRIGDQHRPDLFALAIELPAPLYQRVLEVPGRIAANGEELEPLQLSEALQRQVEQAWADGVRSVAVALLHSVVNPSHEQAIGAWLASLGFDQIALSHQVSPLPRLVPRGHTTVLEAAVAPVLSAYLQQLRGDLGSHVPLQVMQSSGLLTAPEALHAKDTILSGPAGGLVGAARTAAAAGFQRIVGFDMGGTSTDVCYVEGAWPRQQQVELGGVPIQAPMLAIHTVAAGGGSCVSFDGLRLAVGPDSAGADPGPACYRRGGPLTITDANLLLGRLQPQHFPAVFGSQGDQPLDLEVVQQQFEALAAAMGCSPEQAAEGALAVALERMAEAIRRISIQQGHDLSEAVLCSFGGAGGQHACALAELLGMRQVLLHPLAGVLSAYGIGLAEQGQVLEQSVAERLSDALLPQLEHRVQWMLESELPQGVDGGVRLERHLHLRWPGSDQALPVPWPQEASAAALAEAFQQAYRARYGYLPSRPSGPAGWPEVERFSLELTWPGAPLHAKPPADASVHEPPNGFVRLHIDGAWQRAPLWRREHLALEQQVTGPALIAEATGTILLLPGWRARVLPAGELLLEQQAVAARPSLAARESPLDPIQLELFSHRFMAIAEQMGTRLQQTSASVNIRERLDFSCALFDAVGRLVANAPHIPVHLGSMGESVLALLRDVQRGALEPLAPGDAVVSNNPFNGGTHLPDLTVISPVFAGEQLVAFVASRGHHADVGGITPGSMPPNSTSIEQEGLLLDNVPLVRHGSLLEADWRKRLRAGAFPVRNPDQLMADLQAQVAANHLGVERLLQLMESQGVDPVCRAMGQVQSHAAEAVRRVIDQLADGAARLRMDCGAEIAVAVQVDHSRRRARIDFSGSSPQQASNLNAPLAITKAVVLYVFRCLVQEPIPLNAGCFEPLELVVPEGSLLNPLPPAAVVAGNVETSQAVANALFAALGVQAAAQGTMNNLSFGNARCQYYETICGGTGAGEGYAGASAVQSHMTNSRLTDPEILEQRLPVRLERFTIRQGSGGAGRWRGGDGVMRELRALEPITLSLLTGSREVAPFGLAGGEAGACGANGLLRADGELVPLPGRAAVELAVGDRVIVETPGGGGYGPAHRTP